MDEAIKKAEEFVRGSHGNYDSGHDWWHINRVRQLALYINDKENLADSRLIEITALLHDVADSKFSGGDHESGYNRIRLFLKENGMEMYSDRVLNVIRLMSFSSRNKSGDKSDPLMWVVQDADRLDAIGAIGVARAFNYGGFRNNSIYDPSPEHIANYNIHGTEGGPSTIKHFYEKLLLLKDMMNTETGKLIAIERHNFLETFLKQFYSEWYFSDQIRDQ